MAIHCLEGGRASDTLFRQPLAFNKSPDEAREPTERTNAPVIWLTVLYTPGSLDQFTVVQIKLGGAACWMIHMNI